MTAMLLEAAAAPGTEELLEALALAREAAPPVALALAEDPLRLDLPALPALVTASPDVLRALGALYFAARLEDTGLLRAVEWLMHERASLRIPASAAAKLEDIARRRPEELAADQRARLYARLFAVGPAAAGDPGSAGARFEPLLAALCSALVACGVRPAAAPGDRAHAAAAHAARELAVAAGAAAGGGVALFVPRVEAQLRRAVAALSDPGIAALVGQRTFWATLTALLGPNAPDHRRLLDIARAGQQVLRWLADVAPALAGPPGAAPPVPSIAVTSAAGWLQACGLALPRREGWV
jgi:hypothetical protein